MTPEQQAILRRKNRLERDMLKMRQEMNAKYYYPELEKIQADCPHGHERMEVGVFAVQYYCGYCGKLLRTGNFDDNPNDSY